MLIKPPSKNFNTPIGVGCVKRIEKYMKLLNSVDKVKIDR